MRCEVLHSDLVRHLRAAPRPLDRVGLLHSIQEWLRAHLGSWSLEVRERWGLDELAGLDLSRYPVEDVTLDASEELRVLESVPPSSMDTFAMHLRDILWPGVTVDSSVDCPRCGRAPLKILEDPSSSSIVLSCDFCSWSQMPEGREWKSTLRLRPPEKERLDRWRRGA